MKHKLNAALSKARANLKTYKKRWLTAAVALLLALVGFALYQSSSPENSVDRTSPEVTVEKKVEKTIEKVASPLSGVLVNQDEAERPVTAIVIENSPDARPQSSLGDAGVVFEAIAEGGITRYLALYQEGQPDIIGPVRSLRPYFVDWVLTFDASIAHVGGSAEALDEARDLSLKDLDQFSYESSFYRTTDRFAPHNVYTDFDKLDALNERLGYSSSSFTPWTSKADSPLTTPAASTITVNISSYTYQSSYIYDIVNNNYKRTIGGASDIDRETEVQHTPKVVLVIEANYEIEEDGRYQYELVGSGKVTAFQDGDAIVGTWTKESRESQFVFTDDTGNEIALNRGQTWVTVISPDQEVTYTP